MEGLLLILLLAAVLLVPAIFVLANYNRLVAVRAHLRESWADIDVELQRRYELIPNLVETVKGYAKHEQEVLRQVVELRNKAAAPHTSTALQAVDDRAMQMGVERLMAVAENYPDLKADVHFLALQKELTVTEDRLAAARRFYNGNVRELNELCQAFPANLIAGAFGFEMAEYFETASAAQRTAPRVDVQDG